MVLLKGFFEKVDFEKISRWQNFEKLPSRQRVELDIILLIIQWVPFLTYLIVVTLRHAVGLQPKAVDCTHSHSNHNLN